MTCLLDSGIGGLCALKELLSLWENEDFIYLADTAHLPFGACTPSEIRRYTAEALSFFGTQGADRVLLACGTASTLALDFCRPLFPFALCGVAEHAAYAAANATHNLHIGVVATEATVKNGIYSAAIRRYQPLCEIYELACPSLVPAAESEVQSRESLYREVLSAASSLREQKIDTLLLGCTHFSLLKEAFSSVFPGVTLVDCAKEAAHAFASAFYPTQKKKRTVRLYTTSNASAFSRRAHAVLGQNYPVRTLQMNTD